AAGEVLAIAAQIDAREDDLGAGRSDIDADAHQSHVILQPDRILLQRPVVIELEMIVIVIGVLVVLVDDVLAIEVVVKAVSPLWFLVVGISHQQPLLNTSMPSRRPGNRQATLDPPKPHRHGLARSVGRWPDRPAHRGLGRSVSPFNRIVLKPGAQTCGFHPDQRVWTCPETRSLVIGHSYTPQENFRSNFPEMAVLSGRNRGLFDSVRTRGSVADQSNKDISP